MLILARKTGEEIRVGNDITIVVLSAKAGRVRLGIQAPRGIHVLRSELAPLDRPTKIAEVTEQELSLGAA